MRCASRASSSGRRTSSRARDRISSPRSSTPAPGCVEVQQRALGNGEGVAEVSDAATRERDAVRALVAAADVDRAGARPPLADPLRGSRRSGRRRTARPRPAHGRARRSRLRTRSRLSQSATPRSSKSDEARRAARERLTELRKEARRLDREAQSAELAAQQATHRGRVGATRSRSRSRRARCSRLSPVALRASRAPGSLRACGRRRGRRASRADRRSGALLLRRISVVGRELEPVAQRAQRALEAAERVGWRRGSHRDRSASRALPPHARRPCVLSTFRRSMPNASTPRLTLYG